MVIFTLVHYFTLHQKESTINTSLQVVHRNINHNNNPVGNISSYELIFTTLKRLAVEDIPEKIMFMI